MRNVALLVALVLLVAQPASAGTPPLRVLIVLDDSSSMKANDPSGLVKSAARDFVASLSDADSAGLVLFAGEARLTVPARRLGDEGARVGLLAALGAVSFSGRQTDIGAGVERALYELRSGSGGSRDAMLVITDGLIDTGSSARDAERLRWLREDLLPEAASRDVRIVGIAFTERADWALLQQMAQKTGGAYFRALAREDLAPLFKEARQVLDKEPPPAAALVPAASPRVDRPRIVFMPAEVEQPTGLIVLLVTGIVLGLSVILALVLRRERRGPAREERVLSAANLPALDEDNTIHGILQDAASGERHRLVKSVTTLGRRDDCDVVIDDKTISGQHAQVSRRGGLFYVVDLRSTNGTFLNDDRVEGESLLRAGDVLRLDRHQFRYEGELPQGITRWPDGDGTVIRSTTD